MFTSIDRFVLSQGEKGYQFLQKNFGLKRSTAIESVMLICTLSIWTLWYSLENLPDDISALIAFSAFLFTLFVLYYVCIQSAREQAAAEKRAMEGVSNPFKISLFFVIFRTVTNLVVTIHSTLMYLFGVNDIIVILTFVLVSYWTVLYLMSIDILPPSSSKEGSWIKNLFRKRSLST